VLASGGRFQIMEGPDTFHRFGLIEFDTFEQGVACFQSPNIKKPRRCAATAQGKSRWSLWKAAMPRRYDTSATQYRPICPRLHASGAAPELPQKQERP
jgi:hypothetical protein